MILENQSIHTQKSPTKIWSFDATTLPLDDFTKTVRKKNIRIPVEVWSYFPCKSGASIDFDLKKTGFVLLEVYSEIPFSTLNIYMISSPREMTRWASPSLLGIPISGFLDKFVQGHFFTKQGRLEDGSPDGEGIVRWPDGSWYQGEFQGGLRHGRGLYVSAEDGRRPYGGQWKHGKRDGSGQTACDSDGALDYTGDWINGQPHGYGTGKWPDGSQYTGLWMDGKPHGHGRMILSGDDVSTVLELGVLRGEAKYPI